MRILNRIKKTIKARQKRKYEIVKAEYLKTYQLKEKYSKGIKIPVFILTEQKMKNIIANNELDAEYKKISNKKRKIAA